MTPSARGLLYPLPLLVVAIATFVLLGYVSLGEANRVYPRLRLERIGALSEALRSSLDAFAQSGLPLAEFRGFDPLTRTLRAIDPAVGRVALVDANGTAVFATREGAPVAPASGAVAVAIELEGVTASASRDAYTLVLPVRGRFGQVGSLVVEVDRQLIGTRVAASVQPLIPAAAAGIVLLYAAALLGRAVSATRASVIGEIAFAAAFAVLAALLLSTLFRLYAEGVEDKTEGLAASLARRLSAATEIGVELDGLTGIPALLEGYGAINPDIRTIRLLRDGRTVVAASAAAASGADDDVYRFSKPLDGDDASPRIEVEVTIPTRVVLTEIARGARAFAVLFLACGLVAGYALGVARTAAARRGARSAGSEVPVPAVGPVNPGTDARLNALKPAYFLAVLVDALSMPFLPQIAGQLSIGEGLDVSLASLPFAAYFVALTASLVPAGRFAQRHSLKRLLLIALALVLAGSLLFPAAPSFLALTVGRGLSGIGQGLLLITVQAYALEIAPSARRTRAAAVQVYGYNAGVIAGAAIGGLLATYVGEIGVFVLGAGIALCAILYAVLLVPDTRVATPAAGRAGSFLADLRFAVTDPGFVRTLLLIGILSKFVLAGIVFFGLPLILDDLGFARDDIGQTLMLFAAVTLLAASLGATLVDRSGSSTRVLFAGTTCAGLGMFALAVVMLSSHAAALPDLPGALGPITRWLDQPNVRYFDVATVLVAVGLLGLGQGLTAAPVITEVSRTRTAHARGRTATVAVYRLLERIGHIVGPVLVGALFATSLEARLSAVAGFGILAIICGLLYVISRPSRNPGILKI